MYHIYHCLATSPTTVATYTLNMVYLYIQLPEPSDHKQTGILWNLAATAFEGGKVLANWISAYDEREPAEKHSLKVTIYHIITFSRRCDLMGIYSDSKRVVSIQIYSSWSLALFGVRTFSTLTL